MTLLPHAPLNKIPGSTVTLPLVKEENRIKDLTKLSQLELLDLKEREAKLLANISQLNRLPDKGKRIQDFYEKILVELDRRANLDDTAKLFSELNIASKGEKILNNLEWNGSVNGTIDQAELVDSDDEIDVDPLRVIAQAAMHDRVVKLVPPEPSLITEDDLKEIAELKSNDLYKNNTEVEIDAQLLTVAVNQKLPEIKPKLAGLLSTSTSSLNSNTSDRTESLTQSKLPPDLEQHFKYVVEKAEIEAQPIKEKFKPYKTTISNVHDPAKERERKMGKHWEVTAATPPPIQHNGAKMLPLLDSVEIQTKYLAKLKELQEKQAEERLLAKMERAKITIPNEETLKTNSAFTDYRQSAVNYIEGFSESYSIHNVHNDVLELDDPTFE